MENASAFHKWYTNEIRKSYLSEEIFPHHSLAAHSLKTHFCLVKCFLPLTFISFKKIILKVMGDSGVHVSKPWNIPWMIQSTSRSFRRPDRNKLVIKCPVSFNTQISTTDRLLPFARGKRGEGSLKYDAFHLFKQMKKRLPLVTIPPYEFHMAPDLRLVWKPPMVWKQNRVRRCAGTPKQLLRFS